MKKRTIKHLIAVEGLEAIYSEWGETNAPYGLYRKRVLGLAAVTVVDDRGPHDAIEAFDSSDCGIEWCSDDSNFHGLVFVGEPLPAWLVPAAASMYAS